MDWLQAIILGVVQGLTEFLPVSSSGHLAIFKELLGVEAAEDLMFEVTVHAATVLATIVVFWKPIVQLFAGLFIYASSKVCAFATLTITLVTGFVPLPKVKPSAPPLILAKYQLALVF